MQSKDLVLLKEQQQSQSACNVLSICEVRSKQQVVANSHRATGHDEEFALSSTIGNYWQVSSRETI